MIIVQHKTKGYRAVAEEVTKNQKGEILAVHIPNMGWKDAKEFEIKGEQKE